MHYFEPKSFKKLRRGLCPLPDPTPLGRGTPPPKTSPPRRLRRLDTRAFGARTVPLFQNPESVRDHAPRLGQTALKDEWQ